MCGKLTRETKSRIHRSEHHVHSEAVWQKSEVLRGKIWTGRNFKLRENMGWSFVKTDIFRTQIRNKRVLYRAWQNDNYAETVMWTPSWRQWVHVKPQQMSLLIPAFYGTHSACSARAQPATWQSHADDCPQNSGRQPNPPSLLFCEHMGILSQALSGKIFNITAGIFGG